MNYSYKKYPDTLNLCQYFTLAQNLHYAYVLCIALYHSVHYMYVCMCFVLQANTDLFSAAQLTVIDVSLAAILTPTATNLFTPTATPITLDRGAIIGIVFGVIAFIIFLASVIASVLGIAYYYQKRYNYCDK